MRSQEKKVRVDLDVHVNNKHAFVPDHFSNRTNYWMSQSNNDANYSPAAPIFRTTRFRRGSTIVAFCFRTGNMTGFQWRFDSSSTYPGRRRQSHPSRFAR